MTMDPKPINANIGRVSLVRCEVKPNRVHKTRPYQVQHIEGLCITLLKVVAKLRQKKHVSSFNCNISVVSLMPSINPTVLGSALSVVCHCLLMFKSKL